MHRIWFMLVVVFLAVCTSADVRTGDDGRAAQVYHSPVDLVFEAARLACMHFSVVDDVDRATLHLACTQSHSLGGETHLAINLRTLPDGAVSVSVIALTDPDDNPGWGHQAQDYDAFMHWLDDEMRAKGAIAPAP